GAKLVIYDYPGQFAKRLDGIDKGGAEQAEEIPKIYTEGERAVRIRMEQEATAAVAIHGESDCREFSAGHHFYVETQPGFVEAQAKADGSYLLTSVEHTFRLPANYASGKNDGFFYQNSFACVPDTLDYRPLRTVPKPIIAGTQTAVVVGPKAGEVYTDKY